MDGQGLKQMGFAGGRALQLPPLYIFFREGVDDFCDGFKVFAAELFHLAQERLRQGGVPLAPTPHTHAAVKKSRSG